MSSLEKIIASGTVKHLNHMTSYFGNINYGGWWFSKGFVQADIWSRKL